MNKCKILQKVKEKKIDYQILYQQIILYLILFFKMKYKN